MEIRFQWIGCGLNVKHEFAFGTSRFRSKANTPKTYKKVAVIGVPGVTNEYNSGLFRVYRTKNGHYVVGTYRDGCFYEQFAMAKFGEDILRILDARP